MCSMASQSLHFIITCLQSAYTCSLVVLARFVVTELNQSVIIAVAAQILGANVATIMCRNDVGLTKHPVHGKESWAEAIPMVNRVGARESASKKRRTNSRALSCIGASTSSQPCPLPITCSTRFNWRGQQKCVETLPYAGNILEMLLRVRLLVSR